METGDCNAAANSAAEWNRSAGVFSSALATAASTWGGTLARIARKRVGRSVSSFAMTACDVEPAYGGTPASISYSTAARE